MVYKIDVYSIDWTKLKEKELSERIFNDKNINEWLIHEFILMQQANSRHPIAHTKTRWEVSYSWRKFFRQKWTWRARVWDAWSPIRRHWWVVFWPRNNVNYKKTMPKTMRRKALFWSLTLKAKDNEIYCLDKYSIETYKTKDAYNTLKNIWLNECKLLLVLPSLSDIYVRSFKNLPNIKHILVNYVNPFDLLRYKKVLFVEESLDKLDWIFVN